VINHWQEMTDFQNKMQKCSLEGSPLRARILRATSMCNALFMEVAELQESFTWKLSRDLHRKEIASVDRDNVAREIVDCLFFLHHVGECFAVKPVDLEAKYIEVMANNRRRHIDGDLSGQDEPEDTNYTEELATINAKLDQLINGEHDDIKERKV